jgi:hypothetical protein
MAKKIFSGAARVFTGAFALVAVLVAAVCVSSCSEHEGEVWNEPQTHYIDVPGDSVHDTTTVYVDKEWTLVRLDTINKGDSLLITVEMEANDGEHHVLHGFSTTYPEKSGYEIFAEEEILYPDFSNKGVRGGGIVKENVTDSGYVAVYVWAFPTNDGNVVYVLTKMEVLKKMPVVRPIHSKILSLLDPTMSTRATEKYKVKDAPIAAVSQIDFETEGLKEEKSFSTVLKTGFDRDLMAYDDLKEVLLNDTSRVNIDDKTDRATAEFKLVNKSGTSSLKSYNILCDRRVEVIDAQTFDVNSFDENYSSTDEISVVVPEREVYTDSIRKKYGKTERYASNFVGGAKIKTDYKIYRERPVITKFGITVDFGYGSFDIKEGNSDVDTNVESDRAEHDKAIFTNRINTVYMGSYKQSFSELAYLYKRVEFKDEIVDRYSDESKKEKVFTPTTETFKGVIIELWKSGKKNEIPFSWTRQRSLESGPAFERVCKDTYNYTSQPSILDLKSSNVSKKGDKGEEWTGKEEKASIASNVEFNGAQKADVLFYATETNDVKLTYKDVVVDFGHDAYNFTLKPSLAAGSVKGDYTVYPYTANLSYSFGDAAAKQATDKGSIKVAVPEEKTFFRKEWGDLESVEQTTTFDKNMKRWSYVWSLHFYNKSTGKRYVLPVILEKDAAQKPLWDFSLVEECEKSKYEKYNSAFFDPRSKTWKNAWAEDAREWLQWSLAEEGSAKKAYATEVYETAKSKNWDWCKEYNNDVPTVKTRRYGLTVKDGRLFATDTYNGNAKITDSNCVNGGWK